MRSSVATALLVALLNSRDVLGVAVYGQCGGINYTGSTVCDAGSVCVYQNAYYSQCLPGSTTVTSTTTTSKASSTTTSKASTTTTTSKASSTTTSSTSTVTGFVKTSGTKFTLNGKTYFPVGTNAYWIAQWSSAADITQAFSDIAAAGYTTVRTWGFNDVTASTASGTYYQLWANGVGTLNTGSNGLQVFDQVIATAKAYGIRLIVPLVNNWSDYGGMDAYISQILGSGQTHDLFYTNAQVIAAYKKYISGFVGRYVNEPGILAWELANEPRCAGNTASSSSCNSTVITQWASTISAYIKSIDSNHLVAIGDEGFINNSSSSVYVYNGAGIGIDFAANLAISTLDFGTFHLYPESWGETSDPTGFGNTWITDHATMMKSANKPAIIEEYGVTSNQVSVYTSWCSTIVSSGLTGELFWQAGSHFADGDTWNDGYAVYPDSSDYSTLVTCAKNIVARG